MEISKRLEEQGWNRYRKHYEEEKDIKREYRKNWCKIGSGENKQKL